MTRSLTKDQIQQHLATAKTKRAESKSGSAADHRAAAKRVRRLQRKLRSLALREKIAVERRQPKKKD